MSILPWQEPDTVQDFIELGLARHIGGFRLPSASIMGDDIILNLGAGNKHIEGAVELDLPFWDADTMPIPYEDGMVDTIYALHFLEHVKRPIDVLVECQRVLKIGGTLNIVVPYYSAQIQAQDLDHKHSFTEDTWKILMDNPYYTHRTGQRHIVDWAFEININLIAGIVERNLCLFTQMTKRLK